MVQRLFIQDWENFSETAQNSIKELITLSLKAREVRFALLAIDSETNEADEENVSNSLSDFSENFEVTSNPNDIEAKPLGEAIPRVSAFLAQRSEARDTLIESLKNCQNVCDDQFSQDSKKRKECRRRCKEKQQSLAKILSLGSFI